MERESFEDEEVAALLNQYFVAVKVDREERGDIDAVYMEVCQAMTGGGGWPLTILMTPEQKPFFAGTYFPKHSRYQMPGLMELLRQVAEVWQKDKTSLIDTGEKVAQHLRRAAEEKMERLDKKPVKEAFALFCSSFDQVYGGFGNAPKFPTPHNLMFLLRYYLLEGDKEALVIVEKTLEQMYRGGIFDHVGGGFSRYATDRQWLIPHFEKMLYDNALLLTTYLETYQLTAEPLYRRVAEDILRYLFREMQDEEGAFYSAQDADSDGVEGKYYVFAPDEIIEVLGQKDGENFNRFFGITPEGNFEGMNIPNLLFNENFRQDNPAMAALCHKLEQYRRERTHLHQDDKILTAWNALLIAALSKAYGTLDEEQYLKAAMTAFYFIEEELTDKKGHLLVRYREGEAAGEGLLDDYAFLIWALQELYHVTFNPIYLEKALAYSKQVLTEFAAPQGGFYLYGQGSETLISRPKVSYDGALPSGNSLMGYNLFRLAELTEEKELAEEAERQLAFLAGALAPYPVGYSFALIGLMQAVYPVKRLVCLAKSREDLTKLRQLLCHGFYPHVLVLAGVEGAKFLENYSLQDGQTTFYICENNACSPPFHGWEELKRRLTVTKEA